MTPLRLVAWLVNLVAIAGISLVALAGHSRLSGPVLIAAGDHGIHRTDLIVVALAVLAAAASFLALWNRE